jgi:dienelactone hydrolase
MNCDFVFNATVANGIVGVKSVKRMPEPGMGRVRVAAIALAGFLAGLTGVSGEETAPAALPGTEPYAAHDDLVRLSISQWDGYLLRSIEAAKSGRERFWRRDGSTPQAYERSVASNREDLRRAIGAVDPRVAEPRMELLGDADHPGPLAETGGYEIWAARWPVLPGVSGEGLLLRPRHPPKAAVILLPDADQLPEMLAGLVAGVSPQSQVGRRMAESGILVLIPVLVDRHGTYSGDERTGAYADETHREWITRQAWEVGRHLIGYEVQKVSAAVDWLRQPRGQQASPAIGVAGYGEGGLIALYSAAVDPRIDAAWVSGYFQPRERVWSEPLYRSVWGLLEEFGDAEIASMVAPRALVIEASRAPEIPSTSILGDHRSPRLSAAPGVLTTPPFGAVKAEWERARSLSGPAMAKGFLLTGGEVPGPFGSGEALDAFLGFLGAGSPLAVPAALERARPPDPRQIEDRQHRTVHELQEDVQSRARMSDRERDAFFWSKLDPKSPTPWTTQVRQLRGQFARDLIGELPGSDAPLRPRSRVLSQHANAAWTAYEVLLDAYPGVVTWGYLLLPSDLKPGERRPVVVCQHGAVGTPAQTLAGPGEKGYQYYKAYAARLASQGFVVFCPFNPNEISGDAYSQLQRKANLLRQSVFSIITLDHRRILEWLKQQPFVDPSRIGFYGMSYGGKAAMRVPPQLEDYCLSICAGDFGDYVEKMTSVRSEQGSFVFDNSYETMEFNMADTFSYAEMAALIAPRPFMVELGYEDGVAHLESMAGEYAKVRRLYFRLGIPERTAIEFFEGAHTIYGHGTFDFLHKYLRWPER